MKDGRLRGTLPTTATARQVDVLAAYVAAGGSVPEAAALVGVRPSTAKRHLADLRARSGLSTEQLIYRGRAEAWHTVASLEPAGTQIAAPGRIHSTTGSGSAKRRTAEPDEHEPHRQRQQKERQRKPDAEPE